MDDDRRGAPQALVNIERAKTGIPGFDKLVDGGLPRNFNVLVSGAPGTGKTIFGLQYLYNGALNGEPGLYVSLDASDGSVRSQAGLFGWNIEKMESDGKLSILDVPMDRDRLDLFTVIENAAREIKAKRIVFDSLSSFAINIDQFAVPIRISQALQLFVTKGGTAKDKEGEHRYDVMAGLQKDIKGKTFYAGTSEKRVTFLVINELMKYNTTNLIITGEAESEKATIDGVSEYVCDGLVLLKSLTIGETLNRTMEVKKMRCTNIDGGIKAYEFGPKGIRLL